ncbi:MAG: hypothetical protein VX032_11435 [SAR324 cluster bacterium]|nr:hypothetical protein [SAR324 cluster bacterium]
MNRLLALWSAYPSRFWLLFAGVFFSVSSSSFIWPFTTYSLRNKPSPA